MVEAIKEILSDNNEFNNLTKLAFDKVDTDRSGTIDKTELIEIMKRVSEDMGVNPEDEEALEEQFKMVDRDNSGYIDFGEFSALMQKLLLRLVTILEEKEDKNELDI